VIFTALHRYLGDAPGPLTDDMISRAIAQGLRETDDLDWKSELPPPGAIANSDFPKDIAAMANSGGGTLVFGVTEKEKAATGRKDTGELSERHESALRSAAVTAISPPIFGLGIDQLGEPGNHCVVVVIPPSVDGPHLIYRNDLFGAPLRNDADTVWMKERHLEAMYRARFDERRRSTEVLDTLYAEASAMRSVDSPAWIVAVAHPRLSPTLTERPDQTVARMAFEQADKNALVYVRRGSPRPLENVDRR
jgi:predicted HTH transcriptional regulator